MKPIQGHKRLLLIVVEIGKFMKYKYNKDV